MIETPSLVVLYGKRGVGKSHLLKYIIYNLARAGKLNYGLVFSSTAFNDFYSWLPDGCVLSTFDEGRIEALLEHQKRTGGRKSAFLILDDMIGSTRFDAPIWTRIATCGRHYNLTVFITVQYIKKIPPVVRQNVDYAILFKQQSRTACEYLYDDYAFALTREQFVDMVEKHTADFGTLVVNCKTASNDPAVVYRTLRAPKSLPNFRLQF